MFILITLINVFLCEKKLRNKVGFSDFYNAGKLVVYQKLIKIQSEVLQNKF